MAFDGTLRNSGAGFNGVLADTYVDPPGIDTVEAFGTATVVYPIDPAGIDTAEAFGTAAVAYTLDAPGIASAESFGAHVVAISAILDPTGIDSAEAFGTPHVFRLLAFGDFTATLALEDNTATITLADYTTSLTLDGVNGMSYIIKAGDLAPSISGTITVPAGIDLTSADLELTYRGQATDARTVEIINDGLNADSPSLISGEPTIWDWHYDWVDGDTDDADVYQIGIGTEVSGRPMTFPNTGWSEFEIEPQLT